MVGDAHLRVWGACGIQNAHPGEITYLADSKYLPLLEKSQASCVLVTKDSDYASKPVIRVNDPAKAFLKILETWVPKTSAMKRGGIHPKAVIAPSAKIAKNVFIDAGVVVGENATIAEGTCVSANSIIGEDCILGRNVLIYENVTIRERSRLDDRVILHPGVVIGADGFGFEAVDGKYVKVPQTGNVWLQESVEIGANSCVDRARFGTTLIKKGTKIDNLVQIAHNVEIGENCLIISQVGIAGSSKLEDNVILAGQVGVIDHVKIGKNSKIGAQSGVHKDVPQNSIVVGSPPRNLREFKETLVYTSRLPKLFKDVQELKKANKK